MKSAYSTDWIIPAKNDVNKICSQWNILRITHEITNERYKIYDTALRTVYNVLKISFNLLIMNSCGMIANAFNHILKNPTKI